MEVRFNVNYERVTSKTYTKNGIKRTSLCKNNYYSLRSDKWISTEYTLERIKFIFTNIFDVNM